ncbi:MAG: hypothetical protein Q7T74_01135 [Candidatus Saccharibacteria bacterium]|nr:hypothetical protein [Candidatus Saccharibacteria bacterium]
MPTVEPGKLSELMDKAELGSRSRKKLQKANGEEPAKKEKPARGHGCATPTAGPARI